MGVRGWLSAQSKRTRRGRVVLGCERLEGLVVMSVSAPVIAGTVFVDKANDGIFNAGDAPLAGNGLALVNARGVVVGTATTDANGHYVFTANQSISTAAVKDSQTVSIPLSLTNIIGAPLGSVQGFDPSKGTLLSVTITTVVDVESSLQAENTSLTSEADVDGSVAGSYSIDGLGQPIAGTPTASTGTFHATTFDGAHDFGGTSGVTFPTLSATETRTVTLTSAADLAAFLGGSFNPTATISAASQINATDGNTDYQATTRGSAVVTIDYEYAPTNALTAGNYAVIDMPGQGVADGKVAVGGGVTAATAGGPQRAFVTLGSSGTVSVDFAKVATTGATGGVTTPVVVAGPKAAATANKAAAVKAAAQAKAQARLSLHAVKVAPRPVASHTSHHKKP